MTYILYWYCKTIPSVIYNGNPILDKSVVKAWIDYSNEKYPELHHYCK